MRDHFHPELENAKFVVFIDATGCYTDCSDDVATLVGYDRSEILNKNIDDLSFDKVSMPPLFERYKRDRQQDGEYLLQHKEGTPILIRYNAWVFDDGCLAATWEPAEQWEQLYLAALIETHPDTLREKARLALDAIRKRQSTATDGGESPETVQKLQDAGDAL